MQKRGLIALLLVLLLLAALAVLFVAGRSFGGRDGAPGAGTEAPEDPAAVQDSEARERRRAADEVVPEIDLGRPPRTAYLARYPEIGQAAEQDPELGAIRGRVLLAPGRHAPEAVVETSAGGAALARVHADEESGSFRIRNVPPGRSIELTARAPGYGPGGLDELLVSKGETLDVGTVYLGAALGPGVDNRLTIRVQDGEGEPVAGARVTASAVYYGALLMMGALEKQPGGTLVRGTTASGGEVTFSDLPPASYDVFAEAEGLAFSVRQRFTVKHATRMVLVLRLKPGLSITGVVVDADGNPLQDATVGALRFGDFTTFPPTTSGEDGLFALAGLEPGSYMLIAYKGDHGGNMASGVAAGATDVRIEVPLGGEITLRVTDATTGEPIERFDVRPFEKMPYAYLYAPLVEAEAEDGVFTFMMPAADYGMELSAPGYALAKLPSVKSPSVEPIEVALEPAGVVRGRVVSRSTGAPIAGADVFVKKGGFPPTRFKDLRSSTDANGEFVLDRLAPRPLSIWVSHVDHSEESFEGVEPVVRTEDGSLPDAVEFALGSGGVVQGRVLDANHLPAAGQNMQLSQGFDLFATRNTSTGEDGTYAFQNVPPGRNYTISVGSFLPGQSGESRSDVTVADGAVVTVDFGVDAGGVTLTGRVLRDEQPAGGVSVSLVSDDGRGALVQSRTDGDGGFAFEGVLPGRYQVTAQSGRTRSVAVVVPEEGAPGAVQIVLVSTEVRGRVVDGASGDPVAGVYVECERVTAAGASSLGTLTRSWKGNDLSDDGGEFAIDGLEDGTYRLRAIPSGYGAALVDGIRVAGGESVEGVEIRLVAAGTVTGTVTSSAGTPIEGAQLTVRNAAGVPVFYVGLSTSGSDGSYTQGGLSPGRYALTFRHDDYAPTTHDVEVAEGGASRLDFTMLQGGRIEAVVRGADGTVVEGASVTLLDASGAELPRDFALASIFSLTTDRTDANGQCALRGVAAGRYILQATKGESRARSELIEVFEGGSTTVEVALPYAD